MLMIIDWTSLRKAAGGSIRQNRVRDRFGGGLIEVGRSTKAKKKETRFCGFAVQKKNYQEQFPYTLLS